MINIDELKFDEKGLIPAVVVDAVSKRVLTLAYMSRESLQISMERGSAAFSAAPGRSSGSKGRPVATISTSFPSRPTVIGMR